MIFKGEGLTINSIFRYLFLIIIFLVIQVAIPPSFSWFNTKPDFLLIITIIAGLLRGVRFGLGIGLITGTVQDLFLGGIFGILTIIKMIIGGISGLIEGNFFKENYLLPPVIIFVITIIHELLNIALSQKLLFQINFILSLKKYILPEALLNALLGFVLYYLIYQYEKSSGGQS